MPLSGQPSQPLTAHRQPRLQQNTADSNNASSREPSRDRTDFPANQQVPAQQNAERSTSQQRRDAALALKLPVPNTVQKPALKHQTSHTTSDESDRNSVAGGLRSQLQMQPQPQPQVHFQNNTTNQRRGLAMVDDSDSLMNFDYPEMPVNTVANEEQTTIFRGLPINELQLPPGWKAEADAGRRMLGHIPQYSGLPERNRAAFNLRPSDDTTSVQNYFAEGDEMNEEYQRLQQETPSRTDRVASKDTRELQRIKGEFNSSLEYENTPPHREYQSKSRNRDTLIDTKGKLIEAAAATSHMKQKSQTSKQTLPQPRQIQSQHSKVHESEFSSSDEDDTESSVEPSTTTAPTNKRPHPDQGPDYSPDILAQTTFSDLSSLPFLTDPREATEPLAVDVNGNPMTLISKLSNLTKMRPEDQQSVFRSLSDEENTATGEWFVQKFGDELKKLMQVRLERRKIALRFEEEVRRRERMVVKQKEGVDKEMNSLKTGGGKLIGGRTPSVGPVLTPRRG